MNKDCYLFAFESLSIKPHVIHARAQRSRRLLLRPTNRNRPNHHRRRLHRSTEKKILSATDNRERDGRLMPPAISNSRVGHALSTHRV